MKEVMAIGDNPPYMVSEVSILTQFYFQHTFDQIP